MISGSVPAARAGSSKASAFQNVRRPPARCQNFLPGARYFSADRRAVFEEREHYHVAASVGTTSDFSGSASSAVRYPYRFRTARLSLAIFRDG